MWTATISKARHFKTEKEAQDYLFTDPDGVADWYGFVAVVHVRRKRGGAAERARTARNEPSKENVALGQWLRDRAHDMEIDREQLAEEHGFDFVGAVETLADHLDHV